MFLCPRRPPLEGVTAGSDKDDDVDDVVALLVPSVRCPKVGRGPFSSVYTS